MTNKKGNSKRGRRGGRAQGGANDQFVTIRGSVIMADGLVDNATTAVAQFGGATVIGISPDYLGGSCAAVADRYQKYRFSKLTFEYLPYAYNSSATTTYSSASNRLTGSFAVMGYTPEGSLDFTASYTNLNQLTHNVSFPLVGYAEPHRNKLVVKVSRAVEWFYNENDTGNSASIRQTVQGLLGFQTADNIAVAQQWGIIKCHYVLHLCDMTPDQGFTLRSLRRELKLGSKNLQLIIDVVNASDNYTMESRDIEVVPEVGCVPTRRVARVASAPGNQVPITCSCM